METLGTRKDAGRILSERIHASTLPVLSLVSTRVLPQATATPWTARVCACENSLKFVVFFYGHIDFVVVPCFLRRPDRFLRATSDEGRATRPAAGHDSTARWKGRNMTRDQKQVKRHKGKDKRKAARRTSHAERRDAWRQTVPLICQGVTPPRGLRLPPIDSEVWPPCCRGELWEWNVARYYVNRCQLCEHACRPPESRDKGSSLRFCPRPCCAPSIRKARAVARGLADRVVPELQGGPRGAAADPAAGARRRTAGGLEFARLQMLRGLAPDQAVGRPLRPRGPRGLRGTQQAQVVRQQQARRHGIRNAAGQERADRVHAPPDRAGEEGSTVDHKNCRIWDTGGATCGRARSVRTR